MNETGQTANISFRSDTLKRLLWKKSSLAALLICLL